MFNQDIIVLIASFLDNAGNLHYLNKMTASIPLEVYINAGIRNVYMLRHDEYLAKFPQMLMYINPHAARDILMTTKVPGAVMDYYLDDVNLFLFGGYIYILSLDKNPHLDEGQRAAVDYVNDKRNISNMSHVCARWNVILADHIEYVGRYDRRYHGDKSIDVYKKLVGDDNDEFWESYLSV